MYWISGIVHYVQSGESGIRLDLVKKSKELQSVNKKNK